MIERRRLLLMRHGAVEYFDAEGRPLPSGRRAADRSTASTQARAMGEALARQWRAHRPRADQRPARARARPPQHVLAAAGAPADRALAELQEIRPAPVEHSGRGAARGFHRRLRGPVPRETRFLNGETIGALLDCTVPSIGAGVLCPSYQVNLSNT
ncbi:MAG: hypothetical protein MZW92_38875 [Comamonadaceae bacterium]|nr:hypothetical protein [Comamonadaceae bacterium]